MKCTYRESMLAAICYADIFSYPLTQKELGVWAVGSRPRSQTILSELQKTTRYGERWITQKGRSSLISLRHKKEQWSIEKWHIAQQATRLLSYIPTLQLVGVTGGLAMNNAKYDDDIDLYCICMEDTVWVSRLCAILFMKALGLHRKRGDVHVANKICLNMFVDARYLAMKKEEQNLYVSHEILQLVPLLNRHHIYEEMLEQNRWVSAFLPKRWKDIQNRVHLSAQAGGSNLPAGKAGFIVHSTFWWGWVFQILDYPLFLLQWWYMKRYQTTEIVTRGVARFHPHDIQRWIVPLLKRRLARYNIDLDKIFFGR